MRPPTALTTRIPHKRVQSKDAASPLDLHHPPAPTEVPAPNDKPSDKDKKSVPSGSGEGFPNGMVRSMGEQLVEVAEVASSVQLIEMNIPHSDGQRKCIICGYADLLFFFALPQTHCCTFQGDVLSFFRSNTSQFSGVIGTLAS